MRVEFDAHGNFSIIKVFGEIDNSNFKELEEQMEEFKALANVKVLFDFSEVEYIDSSGVGVLVRLYRALHKNGGSVNIAACRDSIEKNFRLIRLDEFFTFYPKVKDALEADQNAD